MPVHLNHDTHHKYLEVRIDGKLHRDDYEELAPTVERLIDEHGRIRLLVVLHDFHGWDAGALWEDVKFDLKHFSDVERLAIAGESAWQRGMAIFCRPFTTAKVRYFPIEELPAAREWISQA